MCTAKHQHAFTITGTHTNGDITHQFRHVRVERYVNMACAPEDAAMNFASRSQDRISDFVKLLVNTALHPLCHLGVAHAANLVACEVEAVLYSHLQEDLACKQGYNSHRVTPR